MQKVLSHLQKCLGGLSINKVSSKFPVQMSSETVGKVFILTCQVEEKVFFLAFTMKMSSQIVDAESTCKQVEKVRLKTR